MVSVRTGILFLLLLGLATYAGFGAGVRAPAHRAAPDQAPVEAGWPEEGPVRLLTPWEEYEEGLWVAPEDEEFASPPAKPSPPPVRAQPPRPEDAGWLRPWRPGAEPWGGPFRRRFEKRYGRGWGADGSGLW